MLRREVVPAQGVLDLLQAAALQLGQVAPDEQEREGVEPRINPNGAARAEMVDQRQGGAGQEQVSALAVRAAASSCAMPSCFW